MSEKAEVWQEISGASQYSEEHVSEPVQKKGRKFLWFVPLAPHVHPVKFFCFLFSVFVSLANVVFLAVNQATILNILAPANLSNIANAQGDTTGSFALYSEIVSLVMVVVWGVLADRYQKSLISGVSLILMGVAVIAYPHAPNVYPTLLILKLIFSIGTAGSTAMMAALMIEVVHGKGGLVSGLIGSCSGLGAVFAALCLVRVPVQLRFILDRPNGELILSYGIIGGITVFLGIVFIFALPRSVERPKTDREGYITKLRKGILAGKDPRIALGYASSFFARADEIIITNFISLWIIQYYIETGECEVGKVCYMAMASSSTLTGIAQSVALASAPVFAAGSEYLPKEVPVMLAGIIGATGCIPFALSIDPTSQASYGFVVLLAIGQIGMIISGMAMIGGPYVPEDCKGSIAGTYSFSGALGIIVIAKLGGVLFDKWMKGAPFLLLGIGHCLVTVFAFINVSIRYIRERQNRRNTT
ncbi:hypothetical protein EC973_007074 [Apophysomyces ossiformis]|uniref:Major facilitator superfamily (MFS) profile domain-containing protein n=1 Tax=Apophysomyces ossiformis TaxID=679940 RepID=A0A8H7BVM7_9FUNG|nr:hypothetical protein EC973_007074 [Apophysomyces ossiformis]